MVLVTFVSSYHDTGLVLSSAFSQVTVVVRSCLQKFLPVTGSDAFHDPNDFGLSSIWLVNGMLSLSSIYFDVSTYFESFSIHCRRTNKQQQNKGNKGRCNKYLARGLVIGCGGSCWLELCILEVL